MPHREGLEQAFEHALELAEALDLSAPSTDDERALADALLDMRAHVMDEHDRPDWGGLTREYRARVQEIHSAVRAPAGAVEKLKRRLRQHYRALLPGKMPADGMATLIEDSERVQIPINGEFFEELNVFISEYGRPSTDAVQAAQLAIAAGKLLDLIDAAPVSGEGGSTAAIVAATLQAVESAAARLRASLH